MSNSALPMFFAGLIVAFSPFILIPFEYLGIVSKDLALTGWVFLIFTIPMGGIMILLACVMGVISWMRNR